MTSPPTYSFTRSGRSKGSIAALLSLLIFVLLLALVFDAAWWVVGLCLLVALPLAYDIGANQRYGVEIDTDTFRWCRAGQENSIALEQIESVQLRTRLDLSVSARVMAAGQTVRIGAEILGPSQPLAEAFEARNIAVTRQHFTFLS